MKDFDDFCDEGDFGSALGVAKDKLDFIENTFGREHSAGAIFKQAEADKRESR